MAVGTTDAETSVIDVPFVIRGRVIEPGEDAVEIGGRYGASRFRAPDAAKLADELVLSDPSKLMDLHETPIDEIIDFLVEVGKRLTVDVNPMMRAAFETAVRAGRMPEPMLRSIYEGQLSWYNGDVMRTMVEQTVGKAYLDGWVERGAPGRSSTRLRAIGTRTLNIITGNPAMTLVRTLLTKSDCLLKMPSGDPMSAVAIAKVMLELDPNHPVTKHVAIAYWKGGNEAVERRLIRPSRIDKLVAWGGMATMTHVQQYLVPGIELIAFNPKWSISIVGHEALESASAMQEAARGVAIRAGEFIQVGCSATRIVYVECSADEDDLGQLEKFGQAIYEAFGQLPPDISGPPAKANPELDAEMRAVALDDEYYRVFGDSAFAGVVVSRTEEPVEFADKLNNRVVNVVPVADITRVPQWVNEGTQTIGLYPERLRLQLRDELALHGAQRLLPIGVVGADTGLIRTDDVVNRPDADPSQYWGNPWDGIEPMRRMVRWVIDESVELQ
jgi:hypothetical protein